MNKFSRNFDTRRTFSRAIPLLLLAFSGAGCYMFRRNPKGVTGRVLAPEAKKLVASPPQPIQFPSSLAGNAMGAALSASERALPGGLPGKFIEACTTYQAVHCEGHWYGPYLLQVAVMPSPAGAVGIMGSLAFGIEREGKKEQESSVGPDFFITRWGHRVALVTGGPLAGAKESVFSHFRGSLSGVVKPGGPDAGLEFLERWRRLGIDRSKVKYDAGGWWGHTDLPAFHTPIDAGELFYFESATPSETISESMAVDKFIVVRGKRLIFSATKQGEVQLIFGNDWVQGISQVEDPARASLFIDSVLYDTVKRPNSTMNYDNPDSDLVPSDLGKKY
jgi:hypothetical protein